MTDTSQNLVKDNDFFGFSQQINPSQVITETHATDSYQNVLFSLLRFRLYMGFYPARVTVVTHEFKRKRFMDFHFPAVGLVPVTVSSKQDAENRRVGVVGINPPGSVTPVEILIAGEEKSGIGLWSRDLYGVQAELAGKRVKRGWEAGMEDGVFVNVGLELVVEDLVRWDGGGGNEWFGQMEELPWYSS